MICLKLLGTFNLNNKICKWKNLNQMCKKYLMIEKSFSHSRFLILYLKRQSLICIYMFAAPQFLHKIAAEINILFLAMYYYLSNTGSYGDRTLGNPEFLSYLGWWGPRDDWNWHLIHLSLTYLPMNVLELVPVSSNCWKRGNYSHNKKH